MQAISSLCAQRWAFVVALLCLPVAGCAGGGANFDGRYTSPLKNFSVTFPSGMGARLDQVSNQDGGMVSVHDDFGALKAINYERLPANASVVHQDPARRDAAYRSFLHDYMVPTWFKPVSPNTSILHEKFVNMGAENEYFAVVKIPEASSMVDGKTGKRFDSQRAVLVFAKNGFMYMLSHELLTISKIVTKVAMDNKTLADALDALDRFKASIRFQ